MDSFIGFSFFSSFVICPSISSLLKMLAASSMSSSLALKLSQSISENLSEKLANDSLIETILLKSEVDKFPNTERLWDMLVMSGVFILPVFKSD